MALITVNGSGAIEARLFIPRTGAWHADLVVDTQDDLSGPVTIAINDGALTLQGTAWRGSGYVDTAFVKVVGGSNGWRTTARPKHYSGTSVRIVLGDLLATAGETLSATADSATLSKRVEAWTTAAIPVGRVIAALLSAAAPGANWRVLPDGTLWVGPETWPDSGLAVDDYQVMDEDPRQLSALLGSESPLLLPGTTLGEEARRVSYVEHTVNADGVRAHVWFEDAAPAATPTQDRLKAAFSGAVAGALPPLVYHGHWFAKVVSQSGATIDVEIENPTIAKMLPSMSGIPLLVPFAGAEVDVIAAGRVLVGWSGGDPSKPYARDYDSAAISRTITLNADQIRLGGPDGKFTADGETLQSYLDTLASALALHVHESTAVGTPTLVSPTLANTPSPAGIKPPQITATKVKVE